MRVQAFAVAALLSAAAGALARNTVSFTMHWNVP